MTDIAFIGLGNMGGPMAANLVRAGHRVHGFDLVPAALDAAARAGVAIAGSVADAVAGTEMVITMLPSGRHLLEVYQGDGQGAGSGGALAAARPGTLFIDSSTIDTDTARRAHDLAAAAGMAALDAPVSGGVGGAAAATLTFMVGGERAVFERAQPVLAAMGKRIIACGGPGAGQAAKICNNLILGISMIGVCEAFALAEKLGLDAQALFDVASTSSGQCWSLTSYCPVPGPVPASPANTGYRPGFAAALMLKDLKLAQAAALQTGAATPLGAQAAQVYGLMAALGHGGEDFSAVIGLLRGGLPAAPAE